MPGLRLCPQPTMLASMRDNYALSFRICLEELFDNASDAGATEIEMALKKDQLIIRDNGRGVPDMNALFQMGGHVSRGRTIGRYGVGFKDAALWIGTDVDVDTCNGMHHMRARVNWPAVESSASWDDANGVEYSESPVSEDSPTYTRLIFSGLERKRVRIAGQLIADIAYDFSPGLRQGLKISVDGNLLSPVDLPVLSDVITIDDHFDGLHFRLYAGIKTDATEPRRFGYDVAYLNRLILRRDHHNAFGDYSATRFYGYLELLDDGEEDWTLSKNKDTFEERDELYEYLLPQIESLLTKASALGEQIEYRNLSENTSAVMSGAAKLGIRERRQHQGEADVPPKPNTPSIPTGRKRRRAKLVDPNQPGSVDSDHRNGLVRIEFDYHDANSLGYVQDAKTTTIIHLNPDFPVDFRDRSVLIAYATTLYVNYRIHDGGDLNRRLHWPDKDAGECFVEELSRLLRNVVLAEGELSRREGANA